MSADLSKFTFSGRLGFDAETSDVNGTPLCTFNVGVTQYRGPNKDPDTGWYRCQLWGKRTSLAQYLTKGKQVFISGRLVQDRVGSGDDLKVYYSVDVDELVFGASPKGETGGEAVRKQTGQDADLPDDPF